MALLSCATATGGRAAANQAQDAASEQKARQLFYVGRQAFAANDFDSALTAFRASYEAMASPNSRMMIAKSLVALERWVDAYEETRAVRDEAREAAKTADKYNKTAEEAETMLTRLSAEVALVRVLPAAAVDVRIDGEAAPVGAETIVLAPGKHQIEASVAGEVVSREVTLAAGSESTVDFSPPSAAQPADPMVPSPVPPPGPAPPAPRDTSQGGILSSGTGVGAILAATVGVSAVALGAAFVVESDRMLDDVPKPCPGNCTIDQLSQSDEALSVRTAGHAAFGVGLAALLGGAAMFAAYSIGAEDEVALLIVPNGIVAHGRF